METCEAAEAKGGRDQPEPELLALGRASSGRERAHRVALLDAPRLEDVCDARDLAQELSIRNVDRLAGLVRLVEDGRLVRVLERPAVDAVVRSIQAALGEPLDVARVEAAGADRLEVPVPVQRLFGRLVRGRAGGRGRERSGGKGERDRGGSERERDGVDGSAIGPARWNPGAGGRALPRSATMEMGEKERLARPGCRRQRLSSDLLQNKAKRSRETRRTRRDCRAERARAPEPSWGRPCRTAPSLVSRLTVLLLDVKP